ncbi:hypothetical protein AAMO2058_001622800 [Amorphochlora amoebiformis]
MKAGLREMRGTCRTRFGVLWMFWVFCLLMGWVRTGKRRTNLGGKKVLWRRQDIDECTFKPQIPGKNRIYSNEEAEEAIDLSTRDIFRILDKNYNYSDSNLSPALLTQKREIRKKLRVLLEMQKELLELENEVGEVEGYPQMERSLKSVLLGCGVSEQAAFLFERHQIDLKKAPSFTDDYWEEIGITNEQDQKHIIEAFYLCKAADLDPTAMYRYRTPDMNPFAPVGPYPPLFADPEKEEENEREARRKLIKQHIDQTSKSGEKCCLPSESATDRQYQAKAPVYRTGGPEYIGRTSPRIPPKRNHEMLFQKELDHSEKFPKENSEKFPKENSEKFPKQNSEVFRGESSENVLGLEKEGGEDRENDIRLGREGKLRAWSKYEWDSYYHRNHESFERITPYADKLRRYLEEKLCPSDRILILGSGLSYLSQGLYADGFFFISNVEFSETAVQIMAKRTEKKCRLMKWYAMDARDMYVFKNKTFDVIVDKGMMDSLLTPYTHSHADEASNETRISINKLLKEVHRVLKPGGSFIQVSESSSESRFSWLSGYSIEGPNASPKPYEADITNMPYTWIANLVLSLDGGGYVYECIKTRELGGIDILPQELLKEAPISRQPLDLRSPEEQKKGMPQYFEEFQQDRSIHYPTHAEAKKLLELRNGR